MATVRPEAQFKQEPLVKQGAALALTALMPMPAPPSAAAVRIATAKFSKNLGNSTRSSVQLSRNTLGNSSTLSQGDNATGKPTAGDQESAAPASVSAGKNQNHSLTSSSIKENSSIKSTVDKNSGSHHTLSSVDVS